MNTNCVLLVQKNTPKWQAGKFNAVGGKIEESDPTDYHAMVREFYEETKIQTTVNNWTKTVQYVGVDFEVSFFLYETDDNRMLTVPSTNDVGEVLAIYPLSFVPKLKTIPNIQWILPLSLDKDITKPVLVTDSTMSGHGQTK